MFRLGTLLLVVVVAGCGSRGEGLLPVTGSVTYSDGQPVTGEMATIVFFPDGSSANVPAKSASGQIQPDGSFTLMTSQPDDGALPGDYRVVLKVWSNYREQKSAVPATYSDQTTTPLRAKIDRETTEFNFSVER